MQLYSNIEYINEIVANFEDESFEKYFHQLVDYWLSRTKLNYQTYSHLIQLEHWWNLEKEIEKLLKHLINSNLDDKYSEHLKSNFKFGSLILNLINVRKIDLIDYYLAKSNDLTQNSLKDFDWSLNLIACSDKLAKLNEPILKLALYFDQNNKECSNLSFELNKDELDEFINKLEAIQKNMDLYN